MSDLTPEVLNTADLVRHAGQPVLFGDDPLSLIDIPTAEFNLRVSQFTSDAGPWIKQFKRGVGIACWAARYHYPESDKRGRETYAKWLGDIGEILGFSNETLKRWRDRVELTDRLPLPEKPRRTGRPKDPTPRLRQNAKVALPPAADDSTPSGPSAAPPAAEPSAGLGAEAESPEQEVPASPAPGPATSQDPVSLPGDDGGDESPSPEACTGQGPATSPQPEPTPPVESTGPGLSATPPAGAGRKTTGRAAGSSPRQSEARSGASDRTAADLYLGKPFANLSAAEIDYMAGALGTVDYSYLLKVSQAKLDAAADNIIRARNAQKGYPAGNGSGAKPRSTDVTNFPKAGAKK